MSKRNLESGALVKVTGGEAGGCVGIVTQPIREGSPGHALVHKDGYIQGVKASLEQVLPAEAGDKGFAQLAYNLIKLGSHVIEKKLL